MTEMDIDIEEVRGLVCLLQHDCDVIDSRISVLRKETFDAETVDDLEEIHGDLVNVIQGIKQIAGECNQ